MLPFVHSSDSTSSFLPSLFFHTFIWWSIHPYVWLSVLSQTIWCSVSEALRSVVSLMAWQNKHCLIGQVSSEKLMDLLGSLWYIFWFFDTFVIHYDTLLWYTFYCSLSLSSSLYICVCIYIHTHIYINCKSEHYNHYEKDMSDIFVMLTPNLLMWGSWLTVPACRKFYNEIIILAIANTCNDIFFRYWRSSSVLCYKPECTVTMQ